MKSITSRLNTFLAKIAGRDIDISTLTPPVAVNATEELLLEIADKVGALPDASEANDGDVLTVDDGEWKATAPSGGSGVLFAGTLAAAKIEAHKSVLAKTWQEIYDAICAGTPVTVCVSGGDAVHEYDSRLCYVDYAYEEDDEYAVELNWDDSPWLFTTDSASGYPAQPQEVG